jgi:hypothetical protein
VSEIAFGYSSEIKALDTERILATLGDHGVEYVLIGGLAGIAHGSTLSTADADILPNQDQANLDRLVEALVALGAKVLVDARRMRLEAAEPWEVSELRRGPAALLSAEAWHFTTDAGPVDVVIRAAGVGGFEAHIERSRPLEVFGVRILVAGIDDLIASKEALSRPKDKAMLSELRDLQGTTGDEQ